MQAHKYSSMQECIHRTYSREGIQGFFRGIGPPLATVAFVKSISFSIYTSTKAKLAQVTNLNTEKSFLSLVTLATVAGSTAGVGVSVIACPLELVKIQRQLEKMGSNSHNLAKVAVPVANAAGGISHTSAPQIARTSFRVARDIIRAKGITGLYLGIRLHCLRDSIGTGVYFSSYEGAKVCLRCEGVGGPIANNKGCSLLLVTPTVK